MCASSEDGLAPRWLFTVHPVYSIVTIEIDQQVRRSPAEQRSFSSGLSVNGIKYHQPSAIRPACRPSAGRVRAASLLFSCRALARRLQLRRGACPMAGSILILILILHLPRMAARSRPLSIDGE